jgi:hypothetical protein
MVGDADNPRRPRAVSACAARPVVSLKAMNYEIDIRHVQPPIRVPAGCTGFSARTIEHPDSSPTHTQEQAMDSETSASLDSRTIDAGRGFEWWREAWALFTKAAGLWIVLGLLLFVLLAVIGLVPLLGALVSTLLIPTFLGSWMLAARKVEGGGTLEVADLFAAFRASSSSRCSCWAACCSPP